MKNKYIGIVVIFFISFSNNTFSEELLEDQKEALSIITDFSKKICNSPPIEGERKEVDLTAEGKAKVDGLFKKITGFEVGTKGEYKEKTNKYKGVLQKELANILVSSAKCKSDMSKLLIEKMLANVNDENNEVIDSTKKIFFKENFSLVEEGLFPESWLVEDSTLVIIKKGKHVLSSNLKKKQHKITIPKINFTENFKINITATLGTHAELLVNLSNNIFYFRQVGGNKVEYIINKSVRSINETLKGQKTIFTIEKKGKIFKIYVNNIQKNIARISDFSKPKAMEVHLKSAENGFLIYNIEGNKL